MGVPAGSFSLGLQTSPGSVLFEKADHEFSQETEILRSISVANATRVFTENNVQNPVHTLDRPVLTDGGREFFHFGIAAADVVAHVAGLFAVLLGHRHDLSNGYQILPLAT